MFFNLIKEIDGLRKETNRLLGKEMSNISFLLRKSDLLKTLSL